MVYRPCKYRVSTLGIFQCERHMFQHDHPEIYEELYHFCLSVVPDRYCTYSDFGFSLEGEEPILFLNCTHPYQARPMRTFQECWDDCAFHDKEGESLG
jgi:hypothetical protein